MMLASILGLVGTIGCNEGTQKTFHVLPIDMYPEILFNHFSFPTVHPVAPAVPTIEASIR